MGEILDYPVWAVLEANVLRKHMVTDMSVDPENGSTYHAICGPFNADLDLPKGDAPVCGKCVELLGRYYSEGIRKAAVEGVL